MHLVKKTYALRHTDLLWDHFFQLLTLQSLLSFLFVILVIILSHYQNCSSRQMQFFFKHCSFIQKQYRIRFLMLQKEQGNFFESLLALLQFLTSQYNKSYIKLGMSYARNIEPQLLSIQAIIQKSQFKSKILNNIPVDLKRLFMQQVTKNSVKAPQQKRVSALYQGLYSQTIQHNDKNHQTKKSMPPLPSRQIKSSSLNSSMTKNIRNIQLRTVEGQRSVYTTRTNVNSRQNQRKRAGRKSVGEETASLERVNENIFNLQNQNMNGAQNTVTGGETCVEPGVENENKNKKKVINRFQYELVLPQKDKKDRGFKKIIENNKKQQQKNALRIKTEEMQAQGNRAKLEQKQFSQNNLWIEKNNVGDNPLISRKKEVIPDFVLAAITADQTKKTSPSKNFQAPQFFELNIQPPQTAGDSRQRIMKPPTCIVNMKKKIHYNKFRRSQQSCQQILQPKINFVRLVQKDKATLSRKGSDGIQKQKRILSKDRIPSYKKIKERRANIQQDVKGWDFVEGPHFYDQY